MFVTGNLLLRVDTGCSYITHSWVPLLANCSCLFMYIFPPPLSPPSPPAKAQGRLVLSSQQLRQQPLTSTRSPSLPPSLLAPPLTSCSATCGTTSLSFTSLPHSLSPTPLLSPPPTPPASPAALPLPLPLHRQRTSGTLRGRQLCASWQCTPHHWWVCPCHSSFQKMKVCVRVSHSRSSPQSQRLCSCGSAWACRTVRLVSWHVPPGVGHLLSPPPSPPLPSSPLQAVPSLSRVDDELELSSLHQPGSQLGSGSEAAGERQRRELAAALGGRLDGGTLAGITGEGEGRWWGAGEEGCMRAGGRAGRLP